MRLNLERLDANGLDLTFGSNPPREHRLSLGATIGLRGTLSRSPDLLRLADVEAESLLVSFFRLEFERFVIVLQAEGALSNLTGSYERQADSTQLDLEAQSFHAPELALDFEHFQLRGQLRAEDVRVHIAGSEGKLQARSLQIDGLEFVGTAALTAKRVMAKNIDVSWGPGGYVVLVGDAQVPDGRAEIDLSKAVPASSAEEAQSVPTATSNDTPSLVDWNVLDGLSGSLDVDTFVDMKVPVIATRQATHPFRISIQAGTVNYRDLEGDLAALEDSLLDFAVRGDRLVLERGIPLLPTRGRGKPLVSWALSPDDLELTRQDRVRLAVLPHGQKAAPEASSTPDRTSSVGARSDGTGSGGARSDSGGSDLALRRLSFLNVQGLLRLEPIHPTSRPLRDLFFEELFVHGTVHHRAVGEPRNGELTGRVRGLSGRVTGLPLGTNRLDVGTLQLGEMAKVHVPFRGIHPQKVTFELANLRATSLSVGNRSA